VKQADNFIIGIDGKDTIRVEGPLDTYKIENSKIQYTHRVGGDTVNYLKKDEFNRGWDEK